MSPPPDELRYRARLAVDRRIAEVLGPMPCFCTPQRPELGRLPWCAKHWVLSRLDVDRLVDAVLEDDDTAADFQEVPPAAAQPAML